MAGKVVKQSLVLLANFGHCGKERSSKSATSHIREPLNKKINKIYPK